MKKLALPAFLASVALFAGGVAITKEDKRAPNFDTLLDMDGVRVVEIRAKNEVAVKFCAKSKPRVTADNDGGTEVAANRSGDRMVIVVRIKYYDSVEVCLPRTVRELVLQDASVTTGKGVVLDDLAIVSTRNLGWDGQARNLRILARARPPTCKENCGNDVSVEGAVGALELVVEAGEAQVIRPETMGSVHVALGPESTLEVDDSRDPGRVRLTDLAGRQLPTGGPALPVRQPAPDAADAAATAAAVASDAVEP